MSESVDPRITSEEAEAIDKRRRTLLTTTIQWSLGATLIGTGVADAAMCIDPDDLSRAQLTLRKEAEYRDSYSDEKQTCRHCKFFTAREGDCGNCSALGGPVEASGHCTSWTERK